LLLVFKPLKSKGHADTRETVPGRRNSPLFDRRDFSLYHIYPVRVEISFEPPIVGNSNLCDLIVLAKGISFH
jgi:hypothetical protein